MGSPSAPWLDAQSFDDRLPLGSFVPVAGDRRLRRRLNAIAATEGIQHTRKVPLLSRMLIEFWLLDCEDEIRFGSVLFAALSHLSRLHTCCC